MKKVGLRDNVRHFQSREGRRRNEQLRNQRRHVTPTSCTFHFASFPQDGWTAVLLAARYGHKQVVQELCETFGADFLHRKKVKAMQTISGSEWLSELCKYFSI